ncbi:hypothetical protein [Chryseobacterium sp. ISL-6]|nr:hypothetical protein [Chryseobacterium sp. ISL-6]MBT2620590.1 hypothetical protein [Chryseobacterium sp. ISL-6]
MGTSSSSGTAQFDLSLGGKDCKFTVPVQPEPSFLEMLLLLSMENPTT